MSPDQRARALRLADGLSSPMGEPGVTGWATMMDAANLLRELAAEQPRVQVPLKQEQIDAITSMVDWQHGGGDDWATHFCRAVERAHGIVGSE